MPELFESTSIRNITLKNRFVRSATLEGMGGIEYGICTSGEQMNMEEPTRAPRNTPFQGRRE